MCNVCVTEKSKDDRKRAFNVHNVSTASIEMVTSLYKNVSLLKSGSKKHNK